MCDDLFKHVLNPWFPNLQCSILYELSINYKVHIWPAISIQNYFTLNTEHIVD